MEQATRWDKALRFGTMSVAALLLYAMRSWMVAALWLVGRIISAVWGHCVWRPTWLGTLFNVGVLICACE